MQVQLMLDRYGRNTTVGDCVAVVEGAFAGRVGVVIDFCQVDKHLRFKVSCGMEQSYLLLAVDRSHVQRLHTAATVKYYQNLDKAL